MYEKRGPTKLFKWIHANMNSCMTCMRFIHWFIVNSFIVKWIQLYEFISAQTWTPHLQHPKVTHCSPYKFTNVHIVRNTQWFWQYLSESPSDSDSDSDNICQNHPVILISPDFSLAHYAQKPMTTCTQWQHAHYAQQPVSRCTAVGMRRSVVS